MIDNGRGEESWGWSSDGSLTKEGLDLGEERHFEMLCMRDFGMVVDRASIAVFRCVILRRSLREERSRNY